MQAPIRVGIADDDPFMRVFLSRSLGRSPELRVVASADDGVEAVELACGGGIDVLVLDLEMPRMSGAEALRKIRALAPHVQVVVYSSLPASGHAAEMIRAGATAYLEKPSSPERMVQAIRQAHHVRQAFAPAGRPG
jgi:DNA-binding NarL/FixJ family response regulator